MVNKCAAHPCKTGYKNSGTESLSTFHFPLQDEALNEKWVRFVNRAGWIPSKHSVLCELHFDDNLINRSGKSNLKWVQKPVPTKFPPALAATPSVLPTPRSTRRSPLKRVYQPDEFESFRDKDKITCLDDIINSDVLSNFERKSGDDFMLFYNLVFDHNTQFPKILESIRVDSDLHVQLQYNGSSLPLPRWFTHGHCAKLNRFSMLENFPAYIKESVSENHYEFLDELAKRKLYKPQGRPPYSADLIRFALHLRYTSLQAYKLLLEQFPMPSISLLNKIQQGGVDAMKALNLLREKGKISNDLVMNVDEMYLQKSTQYQGGEYVGADQEGNLYKGIVAFLVLGLKESIPYVVKAVPEVTFTGKWLADQISENIHCLISLGFVVRAIVADNHSANVNAFSCLVKNFNSPSRLYIKVPSQNKNTYLFYDNVHLIKNVRNNLLNGKKFVFPPFVYNDNQFINIDFPAGYISWGDLHNTYDKDKELQGNLKKCPKLTYTALHPGANKQSVPLALAIFHETTIAGIKTYYPERRDLAGFLQIIHTWWNIANSKQKFSPNVLNNAIVSGDGKVEFYVYLADWIETWCESPYFTLTANTANAIIVTLRGQTMLIKELITEDQYEFVLTGRLQSDAIERRFSRYRQMSGGRFLVSLREVLNSERILACQSLIKANVNFWEENLKPDVTEGLLVVFDEVVCVKEDEIKNSALDSDSQEVAITIAGYVTKKLVKRTKCEVCKVLLSVSNDELANDMYLSALSRGGLITPSKRLADFVCSSFAALDHTNDDIMSSCIPVRQAATFVLQNYGPVCDFTCNEHKSWGFHFASKIVINIFFNNAQKLAADSVRKDTVKGFKTRQRAK